MTGFNYVINLTTVNGGAFGKLAAMAGGFENSLDRINNATANAGKQLNTLGRNSMAWLDGLKGMATGLLGQLAALGGGLAFLKMTADMEQTHLAFEVMLKDVGKARTLIGELNQFANATPFTNNEVLNAGKNLAAFGFEAEQIPGYLRMIGDVASGLNVPLGELSGIFGKMKVRNIIQAEELELFTDRGIPIITQLAKVLGVADSAVYKMAKNSEINFTHVAQAFDNMTGVGGQFENMMARQAETLGGKWSTFMGTLQQTAMTVGEKLIPPLVSVINLLIPMAEWVGRNTETLLAFGVGFGSVYAAELLYNAATGIAALVTGGLTGAVNTLTAAFLANPLGWIAVALGAVSAAVVYAWKNFEGFRGFIFGMWGVIKELGNIIWDYAIAPLSAFGKTLAGFLTFDTALMAEGMADGVKAMEKIINSSGITDRIKNAWGTGWDSGINDFRAGSAADQLEKAANPSGALGKMTFGGGGTDGKGSKGGDATKLSESITGGGQRNITINLGKFQDQIVIHTTNMKEGVEDMTAQIQKAFLQVLNTANQAQGH